MLTNLFSCGNIFFLGIEAFTLNAAKSVIKYFCYILYSVMFSIRLVVLQKLGLLVAVKGTNWSV